MTKKEVCALLGISPKTLQRRMASGRYAFTKAEGPYGAVSFSYADIGMPEPTPAPEPSGVKVGTHYEDEPIPATTETPKARSPHDFAEAYKCGEATDSLGNTINGGNDRFPSKGIQSLLGPIDPMPKALPDTTAHMMPGTVCVGGNERVENPVDSDAYMELIHPGFAERKAQMYASCGVRPLSQQQQKEYNDKLALHAAFRWAR